MSPKARSVLALLLFSQQVLAASPAELRYQELCAGCHTSDMRRAFRDAASLRAGDEEAARVIREGRTQRGMPSFGALLSQPEIDDLVRLLRERVAADEAASGAAVGRTIEAEALNAERSAGYLIGDSSAGGRVVGHINSGSQLCYEGIDLTGIKSIEYRYAKGEGHPPRRFALLAYPNGALGEPVHLGEKITALTGGWDVFRSDRIGLARPLVGRHDLCFVGMEGLAVFNLDKFTFSDEPGTHDGITKTFAVANETITAGGHSFRLEKIAELPGEVWSIDFLSDGSIVATQKSGTLWVFKNAKASGPIEGTPNVNSEGQGGLLSVRVHPQHARNGWVYLTYADPSSNGAMTSIVRGRLQGNRWTDEQVLYRADEPFYSESGEHYGARLEFAQDYLYFSIGDRGERGNAQSLQSPAGKIHRLSDDGTVPKDNPFARDSTAQSSIWSYGHRNPQGLAIHPRTGAVWSSEHGPRGGDELNRILPGRNYGWPIVTFGTNYDGTTISELTHKPGLESPQLHWTPSTAVSQIAFYIGERFPKWQDHLLVGSLARQDLRLVRVDRDAVTDEEVLFEGMGRVRDVVVDRQGYPYVVLNHPNGMIYRLVPAEEERVSSRDVHPCTSARAERRHVECPR